MKNTLPLLFLIVLSCFALVEKKVVVPKPYQLNLGVWLRKNPETSVVWKLKGNDTTLHYYKHHYIPMFRLYTPRLTVLDTNYHFIIETSLESYFKGKLIERNFKRGEDYIHAGQDGWIDSLDVEKLKIRIAYRLKNDTISKYTVDSTKINILLDREGQY